MKTSSFTFARRGMSVKVIYLSGPLQVAEVNVGDKENGLSLQVGQGLEISGVGLLGSGYHADASVFPWTKKKENSSKKMRSTLFHISNRTVGLPGSVRSISDLEAKTCNIFNAAQTFWLLAEQFSLFVPYLPLRSLRKKQRTQCAHQFVAWPAAGM